MKIYLAGPLFTTPEREFNVQLASRLRALGHEVFVPQENPASGPTGTSIFQKDLKGLDWADGVVAIMDGADPDSGTCWECGYASSAQPVSGRWSEVCHPDAVVMTELDVSGLTCPTKTMAGRELHLPLVEHPRTDTPVPHRQSGEQ